MTRNIRMSHSISRCFSQNYLCACKWVPADYWCRSFEHGFDFTLARGLAMACSFSEQQMSYRPRRLNLDVLLEELGDARL